MPRGTCFLGTSGWNYPHWRGVFYPPGVPVKDWLRFYAAHFRSVEVNGTFYRKPSATAVAAWQATVPPDFYFAVKVWRGITHFRKLRACADLLEGFLPLLTPLTARGPLLVQLPAAMPLDLPRLDAFLAEVQRQAPAWRVAVEFRHPQWAVPEVTALLDRWDVALVVQDSPGAAVQEPNHASFVYVRRHGSAAGWGGCYAPEALARDAERVAGWLDQGRDVYAYFNNDGGGHAVRNALDLRQDIGLTR